MSESSVAVTGTNDPSARIRRIPTPIASPGNCVICGKNEHPQGFAATDNLDFEFYGTVYFCADCVGDYARCFGYVSPNDLIGLREHVDAQNDELNTLRQAVLGLESTVDGLIADAHRRSTDRAERIERSRADKRDDDGDSDSVDEPDARPTDVNATGTDQAPKQAERPVAQPSVEQGPNDLHDTSTADELLGL